MSLYNKEFNLAKNLAKEVGVFLRNQEKKIVALSDNKDIKLELDKESEKIILDQLALNSDFPILSEESGLQGALLEGVPYWIVDPIDGTMNYSTGFPMSCVSIALWKNNSPIFGVVYDFNRDELFTGMVNLGAFLNETPLQKREIKEKSKSVLATGIPTYVTNETEYFNLLTSKIKEFKKIRMIGSAALSLCYVANGRFDNYWERNIKIWDVAAGIAIIIAQGIPVEYKFLNDNLLDVSAG